MAPEIEFFDVREEPFEIYGLLEPKVGPLFRRLPDSLGIILNKKAKENYLCTAGGRVRFSACTGQVAIKVTLPEIREYDHMPLTNVSGFDLYVDTEGDSRFYRSFRPGRPATEYEAVLRLPDSRPRYFTINFPPYSPVSSLYVGLDAGVKPGPGLKYRSPLPVVYYGSSITQGACASHPGNTYPAIISRRMNLDYLNFGFSGGALGEEEIARHLASLDMLAFISDYDHNAPNAGHLAKTHFRLYSIIRERHPDIPYIMLSRPGFTYNISDSIARRDVIIDTYRRARELGDKNVYYIDGEGIFRGPDEDLCTVDGTHPTDVGFLKIADALHRILVRALRNCSF
ncbi:MAG: SGNH/GDSL hydrolase family protein [Eubacteriales bacterium]|jgi:hypothetical protein